MSATRLLVLGVVREYGQAHGYQVRRELLSWGAEEWANVKPGSLYHALRQLAKVGMLRTVAVEESDEGPERTLYELTEDGETEFRTLLRKALSDPDVKPEFFGAGLTFLPCLQRWEAITSLRHRFAQLEGKRGELRVLLDEPNLPAKEGKPEHIWELFQWWVARTRVAAEFTAEMIERLKNGAYAMADDDGPSFGQAPPRDRIAES
ncbi:DNA-binding PadR family transcriptional regulator [Lipingzhangella halophila]|uniref:DNA-binding PadR family transcriptional regulator n=1 Tax=Lipingzhangella halophila TaxID=1783352 RepID=A0A7W7W4C3_9ACTN|nr:helix-turn-helix transcriptional regulator [Lipingzhangella halophila]MBB4932595.1 DNA-binding PadR family transcriptional regulator [Lipingzhangella halophila]